MWPAKNPLVNRTNSLIITGDSITGRGSSTGGVVKYYNTNGMWTPALIRLGQRLNLIANTGVGGRSSIATADAFAADVINNSLGRPGYVGIQVGTNDTTADDTIGSLRRMYEAARAVGIVVIAQTLIPRLFSGYGSSQLKLQQYMDVNNWMRLYAYNNPGIILVDYYAALLNISTLTTAANGDPITSYYDPDGVHPNPTGARIMGDILFNALDPVIPKLSIGGTAGRATVSTGDTSNYLLNPWFIGVGLGTSWNSIVGPGAILGVNSKVARSDGIVGDWQRITLSGAAAITDYWQLYQRLTDSTIGLNVSDTIYAEVEFNAVAQAGVIQNLSMYVDSLTSGFLTLAAGWSNAGTNDLNTTSLSGVLRTPQITLPATAFYTTFNINMGTSIAGGATCDFARARIVKV